MIDPCDPPEFCDDGTSMADPDDCSFYFWCVKGSWLHFQCSEDGDNFDYELNYCTVNGTCYDEPCLPVTEGPPAEPIDPGLSISYHYVICSKSASLQSHVLTQHAKLDSDRQTDRVVIITIIVPQKECLNAKIVICFWCMTFT